MRRILLTASLVMLAACSSGDSTAPTAGSTTVAATSPPSAPTATTTSAPAADTSTSSAPTSTTTNALPDIPAAVCSSYAAYVQAGSVFEEAASLRHLSVAVGFPRDDTLSFALDVLRGRPTPDFPLADRRETGARAVLDEAFGSCPLGTSVDPGLEGRFEAGILVGGSNGVALLDGTPVIPPDAVGTYLAAFDDWSGGVFALLEIRGLEIVDHRSGTRDVPRDLVLAEDARLHDTGRISGGDVGVVTIWEPEGEFGELTQNLYLAPFDGSELVPVAAVGNLLAGAETISYGGDYFLVTESELGGPATIYSLDPGGERVESIPGLPIVAGPEGDGAVPALQFARFAPDGGSFAYLRTRPSIGAGATGDLRTDVVLQRLGNGIELMSIEIGSPDDLHTSLDYDGRFVIVTTRERLIVVDTRSDEGPELATMPLVDAEFAYFLESGLSRAGDE